MRLCAGETESCPSGTKKFGGVGAHWLSSLPSSAVSFILSVRWRRGHPRHRSGPRSPNAPRETLVGASERPPVPGSARAERGAEEHRAGLRPAHRCGPRGARLHGEGSTVLPSWVHLRQSSGIVRLRLVILVHTCATLVTESLKTKTRATTSACTN